MSYTHIWHVWATYLVHSHVTLRRKCVCVCTCVYVCVRVCLFQLVLQSIFARVGLTNQGRTKQGKCPTTCVYVCMSCVCVCVCHTHVVQLLQLELVRVPHLPQLCELLAYLVLILISVRATIKELGRCAHTHTHTHTHTQCKSHRARLLCVMLRVRVRTLPM